MYLFITEFVYWFNLKGKDVMLIILCSLILFVDCPDFNRHLLCLLVPRVGLEPTPPFGDHILSVACLPIPPPRHIWGMNEIELVSSNLHTLERNAGLRFHSLDGHPLPIGRFTVYISLLSNMSKNVSDFCPLYPVMDSNHRPTT